MYYDTEAPQYYAPNPYNQVSPPPPPPLPPQPYQQPQYNAQPTVITINKRS